MLLSTRDRKIVDRSVDEIKVCSGDGLRAIALCGESVGPTYSPGKSPLELTVVVDRVSAELLRALSATGSRPWRRGIAPPLLFDTAYLESALDVFPLEFLDLSDRHEPLFGEDDVLSNLSFEREHLRLEVEQQLRGKLLHLWEAYLSARGRSGRVRRLLIQTPAAFETIARGILYLRDTERPSDPIALLAAVETALNLELPTLAKLERVRAGREKLTRAQVDSVFESYLQEVRALVKGVDSL